LSIGNSQLNIAAGGNVNGGSPGVTFGAATLSASTPVFDVANGVTLTLGALTESASRNFTKQNTGLLILNSDASTTRSSGGAVNVNAGTLKLGHVSALGPAASTIALGGGTLDLAIDTSVNAHNTTVSASSTIASDKATASSGGVTHTLGTLSIGNYQLSVTKGANVNDNNAGLAFGTTTLSAGPAVFDVASGVNLTLGAMGGAFNFTKQNSGQLNLNTASTRSTSAGGTTLSAGTLRLGALNALNTASTGPLALNGGTLALAVDAGGTFNGTTMTLGGNTTIQVDRATAGTAPSYTLGTLSMGAYQLSVTAGTNLTANSAYGLTSGATTLTGNGIVDVTNNGSGLGTLTIGGKLTGAFDFKKQGAGKVILNTALTSGDRPSGSDTLTAGTLVAGVPSALGEVTCTLNLNGGTLDLANSGINALNTTIGGDVTVQPDYSSSHAGVTHTLGTLNVGANTLTVSPGGNVSSGTAGLVFGATTLSGSPTFNISSNSSAAASLSLGAITDSSGRALTLKGNGAFAQSGVFAGNLGLSLDATYSGVATLSQANTFSGGTIASSGTLKIGATSVYSSPNVASGATGTGNVTLGGCSVDATSGNSWYVPTLTLNGDINAVGGNRLTASFNTLDLGGATRKINVNSKSIVITNLPGSVSWASTNSSGTANSENTGISSWEIASTLGNLTVQNGTLDLETTSFTGGNGGSYGAFRFSSGSFMNFTGNGNLIVGSSVLLLCNGSFNGAAAPKLTINAGGYVDAVDADMTIYSLAGGGNYAVSLVTNTSAAKTLTINGSAGSATFAGTLQDGPAPSSAKLNLAKSGASTQILNGNNTYSGNTYVNAGTLALTGSGSVAGSAVISVNSGAVLDVSGLSSTFVLGSAQTLSNSAAATGTLNGNVNTAYGTLSLGFAPGTPALNVTNGTLTLSTNTIVMVNNTGTVLGAGSYKLIAKLVGGAVAGNAPAGVTVSGNGAGGPATIKIVNSELYLVVGANSLNLVASPGGTNGYLDNVTITATVQTNGVAAGQATGTVQFQTNGVVFGSPVNLASGAASTNLMTLPRGINVLLAIYSGDTNYSPSTNTLNQVVTNHPPVAGNASYVRNAGVTALRIVVTNLLANVSDVDGDAITLVSVGNSTNGVAPTVGGGLISYYNTNNLNDSFSYTVTDGFGGTNTGTVFVTVSNAFTGQITGVISSFTGGAANLTFQGIPDFSYVTERSTNLTDWVGVQTNTAGTNGVINATDTFNDLGGVPPSSAYYRLKWWQP
jgi:autotransporter-associated beta strand protein